VPPAQSTHLPRRQFCLEPVPLGTQVVDLGVHPAKEEFSRGRRDPRPLELEDFLPLALDLDAHTVDFGSDLVEVWHGAPEITIRPSRTKSERRVEPHIAVDKALLEALMVRTAPNWRLT